MIQLLQTIMADREVERAERQANIAALQQIAQNNQGHENHDHPGSKLKTFEHQPSDVQQDQELLDAMTAPNNGEQPEVAGVEAAEKVLRHPLPVRTRPESWTSARAMNAAMMTWEDFKLKFSKPCAPRTDQEDERRVPRTQTRKDVRGGIPRQFLTRQGFNPRYNKPPAQNSRPNYTNNNGGSPKPGGNHSNPNNNNNHPNGNNNNPNTAPMTGSNAVPVNPKDKSTINCYECGVVGHYSNECPKKLARIAANTLHVKQCCHG
ncbi:hypothetical protein QYE76_014434 [Lolium multiflorum]|uniref:CCHC-type domain-containing protein n=1 Tax=Lolium multiflorum TaxID=4521 RepID=A0AAD8U4T4_LOLMU|nr:hypothetical protein QYE76_014434 [Lolium multiflorum]